MAQNTPVTPGNRLIAAEEQTRPYWDNYTACDVTGEDTPDPKPSGDKP
jgi:hypothetical protein